MRHGFFIKLGILQHTGLDTGKHSDNLLDTAHILDLPELIQIIGQGKCIFPDPLFQFFCFLFIIGLLGFLNQGKNVAHSKNP